MKRVLLVKFTWLISILIIVTLLVCVIGCGSEDNIVVDGKYYLLFRSNAEYLILTSGESSLEGTFQEFMDEDDDTSWDGTYIIKDNKLIMTDLIDETTYDIYKNYLVPVEFSYDVIVPDEATFDVTITSKYESADYFSERVFYVDGTMTSYHGKLSEYSPSEVKTGTYIRDGEILTYIINGDNQEYKLFIYNNQLNDSAYYKE